MLSPYWVGDQARTELVFSNANCLRRAAIAEGVVADDHQGVFKLVEKCWGIMLARNLHVRFHKIMVKTGLHKLPMHGR